MSEKKVRFDIISPDGFSFYMDKDDCPTEEEKEQAMKDIVGRYERQGYYSSMRGRISLEDLPAECTIEELT